MIRKNYHSLQRVMALAGGVRDFCDARFSFRPDENQISQQQIQTRG